MASPPKTCSLFLLLLPITASCACTCDADDTRHSRAEALSYKIAAVVSILVSGGVGVSLPLLGKKIPALRPDNDVFFMIKAFAAGVILATGFIHILPDAFADLASPCLGATPWGDFPFTGFVAMASAIATLMVDCFATGFYKRRHSHENGKDIHGSVEELDRAVGRLPVVHTHSHAHEESEVVRHRVVSQVLELGIVVHSVIIGVSLGASEDSETIKPLLVALSFHQFFEGMGLGGCISQAKFKCRATAVMAVFFSLTTPVGVAIGIGLTNVYDENSSTSLIVEGIFNAAAAGILIYMALVDLLAADFMNPRMHANLRLQIGANVSLLLGAGCMSVLAKWA